MQKYELSFLFSNQKHIMQSGGASENISLCFSCIWAFNTGIKVHFVLLWKSFPALFPSQAN